MSAIDPLNKYKVDSFKETGKLQSPRTIKTHLAYHVLPRELHKKGKVYTGTSSGRGGFTLNHILHLYHAIELKKLFKIDKIFLVLNLFSWTYLKNYCSTV